MSQGFGFPAFPVDTHIHRLAQRWGLTNGKNVIQTEKDLKDYFQKRVGINFIFKLFIMAENIVRQQIVTDYLVKYALLAILAEKNHLKQKKLNMEILGIGNAIVDVLCKVDDEFISQNNLAKGNMKLIFDKNEFNKLLSNLKIEKTISGGSVANSIVGLSQLGNKVGFIGKVSDDDFGENMKQVLKMKMLNIFTQKKREITHWFLFNFDYT